MPPGWSAWLRWLGTVGAALAALLVAAQISPGLSVPISLAYGLGFGAVCASALAVSLALPRPPPRALFGLLIPIGSLLALSAARAAGLEAALAVTACLLVAGSLIGGAIGYRVEHPGQLLFVALVSAFADVLSLYQPGGVSREVVQSELALMALALPWPMLGTPYIEPMLGVGDVAFTALYVTATRTHGLSVVRTVLALAGAYFVTMVLVMVLESALPALPLLGCAVLLAQPAMRAPRAEDRRRGVPLAVALFVVLALVFLWRA
jgi:hypothetical protein